ncbi:MAG: transposase, partial [Bacteroidetes bacterium]|nr:transposase [Bacteroidota bacterium]
MQELTLLFKLYNDLQVEDLRQQHMERYLVFIKENHKVAITTHRILNISGIDITFKYKDYKDGNKQKELTLSHEEFLRRFEQHILPKGFVKIRHSG